MNNLSKAIALASRLFENILDKSGKPYILHCLRVMSDVDQKDEELMQIAVLHDVVEDIEDFTIEMLVQMGFSQRVTSALTLLTHNKEEQDYDSYIKGIATNKDAVAVKLSDLKDNSNITRLKGLRKKDFDRLEKYHKAFVYLSN